MMSDKQRFWMRQGRPIAYVRCRYREYMLCKVAVVSMVLGNRMRMKKKIKMMIFMNIVYINTHTFVYNYVILNLININLF